MTNGVSKERLARIFNVNLCSINNRINLLHGICQKAVGLTRPTITAAHADTLLIATPAEQRTDYQPSQSEEPRDNPLEQIVKLEHEMIQLQEKYKHAGGNNGVALLNLVVTKGYLKELMENVSVRFYLRGVRPRSSNSSNWC